MLLRSKNPWNFVPSLYFIEGLPYSIVMLLSVILYKNLDISNTEIAFWTSLLQIPWVLKPLWSPFLEGFFKKRQWIWITQGILGLLLLSLASSLQTSLFFPLSLACFLGIALCSATHDIAADGFYILSLNEREQALFVGIRNAAYRCSMVVAQGAILIFVAYLMRIYNYRTSWSGVFIALAVLFFLASLWHRYIMPFPQSDRKTYLKKIPYKKIISSFFQEQLHFGALVFLLTYRLGEAQLLRLSAPFFLDSIQNGGLGLHNGEIGFYYGFLGVLAMLCGGIIGSAWIAKRGLVRTLIPLWAALNLPNIFYVSLALHQVQSPWLIAIFVSVEQFGYGLGFSAYMVFMLKIVENSQWKTAHYALCTGFMALGVMLPGIFSGFLQEQMGYPLFFIWLLFCSLPALAAIQVSLIPHLSTQKE
ncbi:MAG: MFS transporter [Waddliaceae bacterium]|nr:MFS transporter [Waddliaceae bacterium]